MLSAGSPVTCPSLRLGGRSLLVATLGVPRSMGEFASLQGRAWLGRLERCCRVSEKDFLRASRARQLIVTRMGRDRHGLGEAKRNRATVLAQSGDALQCCQLCVDLITPCTGDVPAFGLGMPPGLTFQHSDRRLSGAASIGHHIRILPDDRSSIHVEPSDVSMVSFAMSSA